MMGLIVEAHSEDATFPNKIFYKFGEHPKTCLEIIIDNCLDSKLVQKLIVCMPAADKKHISGSTFKEAIVSQQSLGLKGRALFHFTQGPDPIVRIYNTAMEYGLDHVVLMSADCPLIPTWLFTSMMFEYNRHHMGKYMTNIAPDVEEGYPQGLKVEIIPFWMLAHAILYCDNLGNYGEHLIRNFDTIVFKNDGESRLPKTTFNLKFEDRGQIPKFDFIINELSRGIDLSQLLEEKDA